MSFLPQEVIRKKRNGHALTDSEIKDFLSFHLDGSLPEYQMSALLMAIYFRGLTSQELDVFVKTMIDSGLRVKFPDKLPSPVDKHSTGGVGDKTSLILAPIVAAAGVPVPMMSGRGLGHTGGTLDKLESIPGFRTRLAMGQFTLQVEKLNLCFIGQTEDICPLDRRLYALRDVTGTVESIPLICASIISKKVAEGIRSLVLDVKFGKGAFMKSFADAEGLAVALIETGKNQGLDVVALLTDMNDPMGRFAGNSVEVEECLDILAGKSHVSDGLDLYADTRELSLELASWMLRLSLKLPFAECRKLAEEQLSSGAALKKFQEIVVIQGGDLKKLPRATHEVVLKATRPGVISAWDAEKIGIAALILGAGRRKVEDEVDPTAGIEFFRKKGQRVEIGDSLVRFFNSTGKGFKEAESLISSALWIAEDGFEGKPMIRKILGDQ